MRVLIVGASGFVGTALRGAFGPTCSGTYFQHAEPDLLPLDIRDRQAVEGLVGEIQPQLIIHPAAQPHVDWCEDHVDESYAVNVAGTLNVAHAARAVGARYFFFSTDYVFDGAAGPYGEQASPRPLNVYGRHKLEAEQRVAEVLPDHLIIRVCGVYGWEKQAKNYVMGLLARSRRGEKTTPPSDQWGNPTYADNLAEAVCELATLPASGVLHVVGPEYLDRVRFSRLICEVFDLDPALLQPKTTAELYQRAARPLRGGLDTTKARSLLKTRLISPREGLQRMRQRLQAEGILP
ncbi:MAG: NAD(P)-dependent oxidoreductase [Deltaproteobacteria bacterium]|nr:NAD(P)-dependent oxidoreductase [Deltaproteobacteria bacterium]